MEFREIKRDACRMMVEESFTNFNLLPQTIKGAVAEPLFQRWTDQWHCVQNMTQVPENPRLVNHFMIGADPEFYLFDPYTATYVAAEKFGLHVGQAFGMDMNARLVELRPTPSHFAFDVLASILAELRWMALFLPQTQVHSWRSSPFNGQDGMGGHLHFARHRDPHDRKKDVANLDKLMVLGMTSGLFSQELCRNRVSRTKYGNWGDCRTQKHGYEYRVFPSWLDTPVLAYLVLVLSKLALLEPDMISRLLTLSRGSANKSRQGLVNLLNYFQGQDDDARLALIALGTHGFPIQKGEDFRGAWGISYPNEAKPKHINFVPNMISGTKLEKDALFAYLTRKEFIKPEIPEASWTPTSIVEPFKSLLDYTVTAKRVGIGEICHDLVCHPKIPVILNNVERENESQIQVPEALWGPSVVELGNELKSLNPQAERVKVTMFASPGIVISLSYSYRENNMIPLVRAFLLSGKFPIWRASEVEKDSFAFWEQAGLLMKHEKELEGKEIGGVPFAE